MDTAAATPAGSAILKNIAVHQLHPNLWNRKQFDPDRLAELAESIRVKGVQVRLIVRPRAAGGFEIVDGERRWRAAQQAGLTELPCEIRTYDDEQVAGMDLLLNFQREEIFPLEFAQMLDTYIVKHNKSQAEVAKLFGKTEAWVSQNRGYLSIHSDLKNLTMVKFSTVDLRALKRLSPSLQQKIAQELQNNSLEPRHLQKRCKQLLWGSKSVLPETPSNPKEADDDTPDPLSRSWEDVEAAMAGWYWSAEHTQPLNWQFDVNLEPLYPKDVKKTMGQFFLALATAMGETQPDPEVRQQLQYNTEAADLGRQMAQAALDSRPEPKEYPALEAMQQLGDTLGEFVTEKKSERAAAGLSGEPTKEEQDRFAEEFLAKHGKLL